MSVFYINCSSCGKETSLQHRKSFLRATRNTKYLCRSCGIKKGKNKNKNKIFSEKDFERNCPLCGKTLKHNTITLCKSAKKENRLCRSCAISKAVSGKNNPMYGKSLHSVWLIKYGKEIADQKLNEYSKNRIGKKINISEQGRKNISERHSGKNNFRYGKTMDQVMIAKYGIVDGQQRIKQRNAKMSLRMSGKNNPMYGKPAPQGSGNGWSGWYKGIYFRSLLELSYVKYLIDNNIKFENGEHYKVEYINWDGTQRNYFPDFYLIDTKEIIEVKTKRLTNAPQNKLKFEAANNKWNAKFKIITEEDVALLNTIIICELYNTKELVWTKIYDQKFKERYYND